MPLKIKAFGLALLAMFALGAVSTSNAFAVEGLIAPDTLPSSVSGEQEGTNVLAIGSAGARNISCTTATFASTSTLSAATSNISVKPTYAGCTSTPGGGEATVSVGACTDSFTASTKLTASTGEGTVSLTGCGTGPSPTTGATYIVVKSTAGSILCEYEVTSQGPLSKWSWSNVFVSPKWIVKQTFGISAITLRVIKGTLAACGGAGGASVPGALTGNAIVKAASGNITIS
jgi:hypothetical protein